MPPRERNRVQELTVEAVEVTEGREPGVAPREQRAETADRGQREQAADRASAHLRVRRIAASTISG